MNEILDFVKPWLEMLPGNGEVEQLWFALMIVGGFLGLVLVFSFLKWGLYLLKTPQRRQARQQSAELQETVKILSQKAGLKQNLSDVTGAHKRLARVQIFIDYANFDKNWVDNAYGLLAEGNQKVRLDWNKLTDVVMAEVEKAISSWQPDLVYAGTFVQASVLPERFTTPRAYKLPKALAVNYYIYAKDSELVRSKLDGKEYVAKKLHPSHVFLKYMMRKLPGYQVHISRRVIARNPDGSPVVMTSRSGAQYIKSGEKAVDSKVIADMTEGAMHDNYDIAVLLGSDTDFLPVLDTIQKGYGKPVVHLGFERGGHQVRSACWSHIVLDQRLVRELREPPKAMPTMAAAGQKQENTVREVAAKLASPVPQESVKQVVQLFTPEQTQPAAAEAVPVAAAAMPLTAKLEAETK